MPHLPPHTLDIACSVIGTLTVGIIIGFEVCRARLFRNLLDEMVCKARIFDNTDLPYTKSRAYTKKYKYCAQALDEKTNQWVTVKKGRNPRRLKLPMVVYRIVPEWLAGSR